MVPVNAAIRWPSTAIIARLTSAIASVFHTRGLAGGSAVSAGETAGANVLPRAAAVAIGRGAAGETLTDRTAAGAGVYRCVAARPPCSFPARNFCAAATPALKSTSGFRPRDLEVGGLNPKRVHTHRARQLILVHVPRVACVGCRLQHRLERRERPGDLVWQGERVALASLAHT